MILPTKLGMAIIGLAFALYLVSMQAFSGILFLLLGILFGCFLLNVLQARRSCRYAHVIPPATIGACEGEALKETWQIENRERFAIGQLEVISPFGALVRLGQLAAGEIRHVTPSLSLPRRGVYPFQQLNIKSGFPFGLVRCQRRLRCPGEILVYPQVYACRPPPAAGFEPMLGGRFTGAFKSAAGDHFHGVRPYQVQDAVKMIHWPSSSKGQGLMVKEFDEQLSGRVALIVSPPKRETAENQHLLDWAARAAGSLALAALDAGFQIEFVGLPKQEIQFVPPFASGDLILEALARLPNARPPLTIAEWTGLIAKLGRKASLNFVLLEIDETFVRWTLEAIANDHRKVTLYLPATVKDTIPPAALDTIPIHYFHESGMDE